jgi:hypothetical protein
VVVEEGETIMDCEEAFPGDQENVPPAEDGTAVKVTLPPVQIDWLVPFIEMDN